MVPKHLEKAPIRPFVNDYAVSIKAGSIVYYCYHLLAVDAATGCHVGLVGRTKAECIEAAISLGYARNQIVDDYIVPIAMTASQHITSRSGAMVPLEPRNRIKRKGNPETQQPLDMDDLI